MTAEDQVRCRAVITPMDPRRTTVSFQCEHRGSELHQHYSNSAWRGRGRPMTWGAQLQDSQLNRHARA